MPVYAFRQESHNINKLVHLILRGNEKLWKLYIIFSRMKKAFLPIEVTYRVKEKKIFFEENVKTFESFYQIVLSIWIASRKLNKI